LACSFLAVAGFGFALTAIVAQSKKKNNDNIVKLLSIKIIEDF
jgi:hypothetical protein